jgi:cytochrome b pre-mRNA-processing protein 3
VGEEADAAALTDYLLTARDHLAAQPLDQLLSGDITWPTLS